MFFGGRRRRNHGRFGRPLVYRRGRRGFDVEDVAAGIGIGATIAYFAGRNNNTQARPYGTSDRRVTTAQMPPGTRMMTVTVPPGVSPGQTMSVNVDGQIMKVQVPQGKFSGMRFQFAVPNTAMQPVPMPMPPHQQQQQQSHEGLALNVRCPPGINPGQNIVIQTGHGPMTVTVPQGVSAGSMFKVIVPPSTSSSLTNNSGSTYPPINMQQNGAPPIIIN